MRSAAPCGSWWCSRPPSCCSPMAMCPPVTPSGAPQHCCSQLHLSLALPALPNQPRLHCLCHRYAFACQSKAVLVAKQTPCFFFYAVLGVQFKDFLLEPRKLVGDVQLLAHHLVCLLSAPCFAPSVCCMLSAVCCLLSAVCASAALLTAPLLHCSLLLQVVMAAAFYAQFMLGGYCQLALVMLILEVASASYNLSTYWPHSRTLYNAYLGIMTASTLLGCAPLATNAGLSYVFALFAQWLSLCLVALCQPCAAILCAFCVILLLIVLCLGTTWCTGR